MAVKIEKSSNKFIKRVSIKSQEIKNLSTAIGVLPGSSDTTSLRYGKVCILADADSDGLHIATLLCALFFHHLIILSK